MGKVLFTSVSPFTSYCCRWLLQQFVSLAFWLAFKHCPNTMLLTLHTITGRRKEIISPSTQIPSLCPGWEAGACHRQSCRHWSPPNHCSFMAGAWQPGAPLQLCIHQVPYSDVWDPWVWFCSQAWYKPPAWVTCTVAFLLAQSCEIVQTLFLVCVTALSLLSMDMFFHCLAGLPGCFPLGMWGIARRQMCTFQVLNAKLQTGFSPTDNQLPCTSGPVISTHYVLIHFYLDLSV